MKQVVAIQVFAGMLARQSGYTADFCESFVIEMFKTVADALKESGNVNIKGLGRFLVGDDGNVLFEPDEVFEAEVNAPFDCFEPELLDDCVTDEILSLDGEDNKTDECCNGNQEMVGATAENVDANYVAGSVYTCTDNIDNAGYELSSKEECIDVDDVIYVEDDAPAKTPSVVEMGIVQDSDVFSDVGTTMPEDAQQSGTIENDEIDEVRQDYKKEVNVGRAHRMRWFIAGIVVGAAVGASSVYFMTKPDLEEKKSPSVAQSQSQDGTEAVTVIGINDGHVLSETVEKTEPVDSIVVQAITPEADAETDVAVYDNVTTTLAQLSRKHYGSYEFWVYIYEENMDVIADPNRVEPQTRVRIPSPEKYGIDANDRASIKAALKKSRELAR